ncbi:Leucine rich repeat-containing protein [Fibrobacter sp. UWH5]|uniref:InlB B-repeat-containing protein n=1 Tax=Fibrobacter sp. UWH5 TaxID=1896211 RepID=UPI000923EF11|nr:leucine-rich repeat protein [Fibrobacter sp. UWH5]SHK47155.1 Leucine rich repeat-containing protein [Fibrobacter sp. UWH5]
MKFRGFKNILSVLAMLVLPTALFAQTAYLDEKGSLKTLEESATAITSSMTTWSAGWYVVSDNVTIDERITVNGDVHLILADGATLNANKGIGVSSSATFNVYAQSENEATMGALVANAKNVFGSAGIGGTNMAGFGNIIINGGKITVIGQTTGIGGGYNSTSGNITINGGVIDATTHSAYGGAGIGGSGNGYVSSITLNGGSITATGAALNSYGGAGIGTGNMAKSGTMTITISSAVKKIVSTKGSSGAECIGQGENGQTTINVIFKDGESTVEGNAKDKLFYDSGEGEQRYVRTKALNHHIVISDNIKAQITANTEYAFTGEMVTLSIGAAVDVESIKLNGGAVSLLDAGNGQYTFVMPDGDVNVTAGASDTYSVVIPEQMEIVSSTNPPDGDGKYISGTVVEFRPNYTYTVFDVSDGTNALVASNGVYSVTVGTSDINITATINHEYNVNLAEAPYDFTALNNDVLSGTTERTVTIANGANITLSNATINGGIVCEGSATIILEGSNNVKGYSSISKNVFKAGIQVGGEGTVLTIKGNGSLTAIGSDGAAGIGLDCVRYVDAYGGDIVIEGGTINAIGSGSGAGIGTGFAYGGANIVRLGNITIKGGSVKATSGGSAEGIGSGLVNPGSTNEFGTVTIYDSVVLVDASSIGKDITYMHGESNVTANKTDYFNISEDGNRRVIAPKDDADYSISIANDIEHGTLTGAGAAKYTEKVTITVTPDFGYRISRLIVKDANNNDVVIDGNSFVMPKGNVTVSAIFEQGPHGTTEFVWQNVSGSIVKENIIYDGVTTLNLEANSNYKIVSKDQTYLRLDKSTVDIPYSDGVGEFIDDDKSTIFYFRNIPSGFYDIILTDLGDDRWSVSILKTVAALDNVPDQTYTGSEIKPEPLVLAGSLSLAEGTDYEYSYSNNINVGTATVTVTFLGEYDWVKPVSKSFNITKATPTVEPPTSANPKYAGACVALVTAGSTNFGTMLYSLDDDDDYSENIPCADKGGDYTVYYKVEESDNWSGAAGSVEIQVPVRVDVTVVGDGSVSGYDPDEFYPVGTVLTLTAEPADGYKFLSWNSDVDVPATFEYTVDAEQNSLEATFSNHYIAYTTSDGDTALPVLSSMYDIKKNKCEDGLCVMFLGDGVTELESGAFHGNKRLTSIEIPSSIETIGHFAFAETPLIRVDMKSKVPPQLGEWMTFYSVPDEYLIHVPHGSADAYRFADGWKDYKDHIVDHDASMLVWTDDAVVPTCSETGWEAGYICNECHKRFADVDGHVEMSPVAALGTTYGAACIYNDDSKAIIDGNSETSVLLPWNIDVDAIELNRTFAAGTISTITLPFSMYVENVEGAVFYRFKYVSSDDWTVHVGSVRDELIANTPYLVKTTGETISFKTGATLERTLDASPTDQGQDEGDGWELRGTYGKMVWKEGHPDLGYVYGFAAENVADVHIGEFVKATAGANLPPMRAYLYYNPVATPAPSPKPSFRGMAPMARSTSSIETPNYLDVVVDDDEGGTLYIGKLNTRTGEFNAAGERWFDMKGRKLNGKPSVKGSFFNNKSKVIVK